MTKTKNKGIGKGVKIAIIALVVILIIGGIGVYQFFFASAKTTSTPTPIGSSGPGPTVASVWQNLYITNTDGSSYWAQAQQPLNLFANLESLLGSQSGTGADFNTVSTIQNNLYMNVAEPGVTAYTFSCQETIQLWDTSGNVVMTVANASPVTIPSTSAPNGQAFIQGQSYWITGATVSASSLQNILGEPTGEYYYVITLANFQMTLTVNGQQQTLTAPTPTSQNMLQWLIKIA